MKRESGASVLNIFESEKAGAVPAAVISIASNFDAYLPNPLLSNTEGRAAIKEKARRPAGFQLIKLSEEKRQL